MASEYARYIGRSTTRRMTKRDWVAAGVTDQDTLTWNKRNGFSVSRDQISDAAWAILANDAGIVVVDKPNPTNDEVHEAAVSASVARLTARANADGAPTVDNVSGDVSDDNTAVPVGAGSGTPGARVQGSDATSTPGA